MIAGPPRPSAGRVGWWIVGCFLTLIAAFWLTERTVDWLWMGALGYRPVFWRIIDLRFALFGAAFIPLALYFSLNLRWTMQMMTARRQAAGAPLDPALDQLERGKTGHVLALEADGPPSRPEQSGDRPQRRGLSGPVRPDQGDDLPGLHVEGDVPDRLDVPVEDVDPVDLQRLHARASLVSSPR